MTTYTIPASGNGIRPFDQTGNWLSDQHRRELETESSISTEVIAARGYETLERRSRGDDQMRERLRKLKIPTWAHKEDRFFPGYLTPVFSPLGQRVSVIWKPNVPVPNREGKHMKYASPKRQALRLDVHPFNKDAIVDPATEAWMNEGIKKGDSLTSRGVCTVSLVGGVYGWRNGHGTLGDWEDIMVKGREWTICFDSDAAVNPNVMNAMVRAGRWLKSKGASKVWYLIVPASHNGTPTKGVDDYFAAGGTLDELKTHRSTREPNIHAVQGDFFTDARMAETIADNVLDARYIWVQGLNWLGWNDKIWQQVSEVEVTEAIREYMLERFQGAVQAHAENLVGTDVIDGWRKYLNNGSMAAVRNLARGLVERKIAELDSEPDWLNTPSGIVDLTSGEIIPHDPAHLQTRITKGSYIPGFKHPDWQTALEALREEERDYLQVRIGQAITGHPTPDGVVPILQGSGENGKSLCTTDGLVPALGDCASMASPKLFQAIKGSEHSTERAELRGKRLLIAEELTEGRSIDVTALKQITDVGKITARYIRQDNFTFDASHSLLVTTNYIPVVNETDHGTWRRLQLVKFPFTFRKPGQVLFNDNDRHGDPTLKLRIKANETGQHDAIVTWAVEGAIDYHRCPEVALLPTNQIGKDTLAWRAEADRILGFWTEKLVADPEWSMLATELLAMFNSWLKSNGHNDWSKESFVPRFLQHEITMRHGVDKREARNPQNVDRFPHDSWTEPRLPRRATVFRGLRKKRDSDQGEYEEGA
jgi:putative DNA primase/helicase